MSTTTRVKHWATDEALEGRDAPARGGSTLQRPWLYIGFRVPAREDGPVTTAERAEVFYLNRAGTWGRLKFAPFIPRHLLKSPTGWNWGYSGSGPAELARHLLWHATGRRELLDHPVLYQKFKAEVVALWGNGWLLLGDRIRDWVAEHDTPDTRGGYRDGNGDRDE